MSSRFEQLFAELSRAKLDTCSYQGEACDLAFELTTTDTFLAGVVDRMRGSMTVPLEFRTELLRPWLHGAVWRGSDGRSYDLSLMPQPLFEHALLLERIRSACASQLRDPVD